MTRLALSPLLVLIIIGVIVTVVLLRKRPGVLAIVAGLFAAVVVASMFFVRAVHMSSPYPAEIPARQWIPSDNQYANVTVLPSAESAARFVATTLAPQVVTRTMNERIPGIDVSGSAPEPIRAIIAAKIIDACPHLRLIKPRMSAESAQTTRPADHLIVTVNDTEDHSGRGERMLQVTAEIPRISGSIVGANAYYENKPWAEKGPGFHQIYPGRVFLVAWSENAAVGSEDAIMQARDSAAAQLLPRVWQSLQQQRPGQEFDGGQIRSHVEMMILDRIASRDRFVQQMGRPYGSVWRGAIRIDNPDSAAQLVAANIVSRMSAEQRLFSSRAMSIGALLVLIVIVYFLLNAITKGYFSKTLQVGAVVALLIGLLALMLMA